MLKAPNSQSLSKISNASDSYHRQSIKEHVMCSKGLIIIAHSVKIKCKFRYHMQSLVCVLFNFPAKGTIVVTGSALLLYSIYFAKMALLIVGLVRHHRPNVGTSGLLLNSSYC